MVPPVDHGATKLEVMLALHPAQGVVIVPIMSVPDTISSILCVHIQRTHAAKMGVRKLQSCGHSRQSIDDASPIPCPVVEQVADMKFIDQMRSQRAGQTQNPISWVGRVARSRCGHAQFVSRQNSADINLVGTRSYNLGDPVGSKESPFLSEVMIEAKHSVILFFWKDQRSAEALSIEGVARTGWIVGHRD